MCSLFVCRDVNHAGNLLLTSSTQHRAGVQVFPPLMKSLVKSAAELCVCVCGGDLMDPGFACQIHSESLLLSRQMIHFLL